jgi:hypothetical protein
VRRIPLDKGEKRHETILVSAGARRSDLWGGLHGPTCARQPVGEHAPEAKVFLGLQAGEFGRWSPLVSVLADTGGIRVRGPADASRATDLSASVDLDGQSLTLRIFLGTPCVPCPGWIEPMDYECIVSRVEAGTYDLTVALTGRSSYEGHSAMLDTVFTGPVTVH